MKQNCKIKDSSLSFELKTVELTKINKLGRTLVNIKQRLRKLINAPDRVRIVKLSNHIVEVGQKENKTVKQLNKNILTEISSFKGKQTIIVRTDIQTRFKHPL